MDRQRMRRIADGLPLGGALSGLVVYLDETLFGHPHGGPAAVGVVFVVAMLVTWLLRRLSGATWRQTLWPRREPPPWTRLPVSMASVGELARAGRRIQAVKMHRELTGMDLASSVKAVDAMIAEETRPG
ncbi:hypothetical protein OHA72_49935 [Dactylosporangium sp. NBC_01737]|uniref:hypothetical protein n=1 Tax=Dactylosporangium sp. NBC_01737 TaxID=2975959 RepID=UPI002E127D55|nr:hypothetical protein OHA72_49935 [Dactylosporangium sp. NBC_01737]